MTNYTQANVLIGVGVLKLDGVSLGYTSGGVNLVHSSDKMDKEVDQSYSAVGVHKIRENFQIKTSLAEVTLANLKIVWEQTEAISVTSTKRTLSWGMNSAITEHTLEFEGVSPEGFARTFTVRKAVVWESGEVAHQKDAMTLIPVTFRVLPDTAMAAGKEYGTIEDSLS
jgi:hypothetical protein